MNLEHDFFQVSKLSEDQKKGLHRKFMSFFPESREDQKKVQTSSNAQMYIYGYIWIYPPRGSAPLSLMLFRGVS